MYIVITCNNTIYSCTRTKLSKHVWFGDVANQCGFCLNKNCLPSPTNAVECSRRLSLVGTAPRICQPLMCFWVPRVPFMAQPGDSGDSKRPLPWLKDFHQITHRMEKQRNFQRIFHPHCTSKNQLTTSWQHENTSRIQPNCGRRSNHHDSHGWSNASCRAPYARDAREVAKDSLLCHWNFHRCHWKILHGRYPRERFAVCYRWHLFTEWWSKRGTLLCLFGQ